MSSAPAEVSPLPALELAPEGLAPATPAGPPAEDAELMVVRAALLTPERARPNALLLLGTLALFILVARGREGQTWRDVGLLVGVLLFHELGHWVGMRAFGFQNVQMFFIPFLGAAVSGRNTSASAWKEAVVLLLGPLPGLLVGCGLLAFSLAAPSPLLTWAGTLLVLVNGFNLLPLEPFDGGRLFQLLVFSRHRYLELAFFLLATLLMGVGAFLAESGVLGFLAGLSLLGLPRRVKLLRLVSGLRASHPGASQPPEALDTASLRALHEAARTLAPPEAELHVRLPLLRELHERVRKYPPSLGASLGLGSVWFVGVLLTVVGVVLVAFAGRS